MAKDDFAEVQRKLEATTSELKTANDPERRRILLREMSRLVAEAERISGQAPKISPLCLLNRFVFLLLTCASRNPTTAAAAIDHPGYRFTIPFTSSAIAVNSV